MPRTNGQFLQVGGTEVSKVVQHQNVRRVPYHDFAPPVVEVNLDPWGGPTSPSTIRLPEC